MTIRDGEFVAICPAEPTDLACAVDERPGTYQVEVHADGYLPVTVSDVTVVLDDTGCHSIPVYLRVELERAP